MRFRPLRRMRVTEAQWQSRVESDRVVVKGVECGQKKDVEAVRNFQELKS
jgi:hypothetical protein